MTDAPPAPTTSAPEPTTPTDLEVVKMVCYARAAHGPGLGAARALAEMKKRVPGLVLSERRLKALMHASGLAAQDPPKDTPWDTRTPGMFEDACREKARPLRAFAPPKAPRAVLDGSPGFEPDTRFAGRPLPDALQRQLDFIANSGASYLIYGPDALDWAVTLTWDRDYQLKELQGLAITARDPQALFQMFMFLYRAGRQRGISAALIRSQLRAEYGLDPLTAAPPPPANVLLGHAEDLFAAAAHRLRVRALMAALREAGQRAPAADAFDEAAHGIEAIDMVPLSKGDERWRRSTVVAHEQPNVVRVPVQPKAA